MRVRENAFHQSEIENIPLPDTSEDVTISNGVINLSTDNDRMLSEAFRVQKPGRIDSSELLPLMTCCLT